MEKPDLERRYGQANQRSRRNADQYHDETERQARIKVIGVGGGGGNAVNRMIQAHMEGVSYCRHTDVQALSSRSSGEAAARVRLTSGLGAGANPDVGRRARSKI